MNVEQPKPAHLLRSSICGLAILFALLSGTAFADPIPAQLIEGADIIALAGATVIDGTDAKPRQNTVIVIKKDRILYVGDAANVVAG